MLSIYAPTKYHDFIRETIQKEDRLEELVQIIDYLEQRPVNSANNLLVKQDAIYPLMDWYNMQPPFLLPEEIPLNKANLLGILYSKLNNFQKTHSFLHQDNPTLYLELDFINRLQQGISIASQELVAQYTPFEEYRLMHNQAIIHHYASEAGRFEIDKTKYYYLEAIQAAPNDEYRAFSARHFAALLVDLGDTDDAIRLLKAGVQFAISEEGNTELRYALCQAWMQKLSIPYDQGLLEQLKDNLWKVLQQYQKTGRRVEEALVLTDAGLIANYSESWSESLNYYQQALALFEQEEMSEMVATVHYRKGTLMYTWAKNGNPQFYRSAAESYQEAIKVFSKNKAPEMYAEIQHHLGIIYAEIPDEFKKKGIWAAVSSSAFQEALDIYSKEMYPYEYAAVCNHYGNALTKYPQAKLSDNYEKAIYYYQEALSIRTADQYPLERCLTLLNYLESQWYVGMPEDRFEVERYEEMVQRAEEVIRITPDPKLRQTAEEHLEKLEQLRMVYVG